MNPTLEEEEDIVFGKAGWALVALHVLKFHEDPITNRASCPLTSLTVLLLELLTLVVEFSPLLFNRCKLFYDYICDP